MLLLLFFRKRSKGIFVDFTTFAWFSCVTWFIRRSFPRIRYKTMTKNEKLLRICQLRILRTLSSCKCAIFYGYICNEIPLIVVLLLRILGKLYLVNQLTHENLANEAILTKIRSLHCLKNSESNIWANVTFSQMFCCIVTN